MRFRLLPLILLAWAATGAGAQEKANLVHTPDVRLDSFGYLRGGFGWRADGDGGQRCFELPGAGAKYRLGNECEVYFEPGFVLEFGDEDGGPLFELNLRASAVLFDLNSYDEQLFFGEELWVGARGLFGSGAFSEARVWAGHRFYRRQDVHINDFYWWDMTGTGFGIENVALGFGKGAVALFTHSGGNIEGALNEGGDYTRLDMRVDDIALSEAADLTLGLDLRLPDSGLDADNDGGAMATAMITRKTGRGGTLMTALQAGFGAGHTLSFASDADAGNSWKSLRGIGSYLVNASDDFSIMATALAELGSDRADWYSAGARPVWRLQGDVHLAVEVGLDHVIPETGPSRSLGKLTAALEWKPSGPDFFSRPAWRLFVTHAVWDDAAEAAGIAPAFAGQQGTNIGVQVETWW